VQAAELLQRQGVVARFALVGNGDPSNRSCVPAEQLERWQRAGTVELWGHQTDMRRVYAQAHVVCLPTFYREGIPKVLLEAAAAGRPIVTTASPGCRDIVHHQVNGLLVRRHDVAGLAAALRSLIENRALRLNFGARGRERALSQFRKELVIAANLALYRELLPAWELGDGFAANRQQF
jgi:glycosyltransferase involved in cell wall biosynthesis